jgi:aryl-phospho-beta-D-glucosidase BglC (GH1 family)
MFMRKVYSVCLFSAAIGLSLQLTAQLTPQEAVIRMQKGINLGNTLEPPNEGGWNNPAAQEYYFDLYKQAGFASVRIPVRWDEHTQDTSPYSINETWLQRVETVIDWGLERDLFIIVNAHHDDWIKQNYTNASYRARFDSIWSQLSVRFRNKSEKLIFEILNEPYGLTKDQNDDLHRRILSIIRKTNPTRIVIFQGHNWGGSDELIAAEIPADDYVLGSFHSYDPYTFGLLGEGTWGSQSDFSTLNSKFATVKSWSDNNHIPVILGEFGSLKSCDYNSRMKHYRAYTELSQNYGFAYFAWDDGGDFRILERSARKWDEVKDILLHTTVQSPKNLALTLYQDTVIRVNWTNVISDYESIYIERRTDGSAYTQIASLPADSIAFYDYNVVPEKYYYYRLIAHYSTGEDLYSQPARILMPVFEPKVRTAFLGEPADVPGTVEAENYDIGGEGFTYHDTDPANLAGAYRPDEGVDIYSRNGDGYHIGNALPGEWYEYTVDIQNEGEHQVDIYLASLQGGGTFKLKIGEAESPVLTAPITSSWLTTKAVSDTMNLAAGEQFMRFSVIDQPLFNIDKFVFTFKEETSNAPIIKENPIKIFLNYNRELIIEQEQDNAIRLIQVFDISGIPILSVDDPGEKCVLSVREMSAGIYVIRILTDHGLLYRKIFLD